MELDLDSTEGYYEQLRQMMIFGETWVNPDTNTIRYRPDEHPWDVLRPAGRRGGKTTAVMQWLDEITYWAATHDRLAIVRDVAARGLTPPKAEHSPAVIAHWSYPKPTEVLKPFEFTVSEWRPRVEAFAMQDSLLDRYRFPYL